MASHIANSIIASTLTRRLSTRRSMSDQRAVSADPASDICQQNIAAALADEHGQKSVRECDQQEKSFEHALPEIAPLHAHGVAEHRCKEADGEEFEQRPERQAQYGIDHSQIQ